MKTRFSINGFSMIINIIFWMLIAYFAGDCGMGVFITAFLLYSFLFIIFMGSVTNAIAKMVSIRTYKGLHESAQKVFKYGMLYSILTGIIVCFILLFGGDYITKFLFGTILPSSVIRILGIYFLLQSIISCLTGYYQGLSNSLYSNLSILIKNFLLIISAPFIIHIFVEYGKKVGNLLNNSLLSYTYGAMGAAVLLCAVSFITLIFLLVFYKFSTRRNLKQESATISRGNDNSKNFLNNFFITSLRIMKGNIFPLTAAAVIVFLYVHYAVKGALLTETIFINVGIIFGKLFVVCLIPVFIFKEYVMKEKIKIHNDFMKEETKNLRIRSGYFIKNSFFILLPITIMSITLAKPIVMIFFGGRMKLGVNMLRIGGVLILLMGITMVFKAILTAIQKETTVLLYSFISLFAAIVFAVVIFPKNTNISMIVYCFLIYYIVQVLLLAFAVYRQPRVILYEFKYRFIVMGIASVAVALAELLLDYLLVMNILLLILSIVIGYVIYFVVVFALRGITKRDEIALKDSFMYIPIHFLSSKLHIWN